MCDICVMNRVKETMLSRRSLFTGASAVGAAAAMGSVMSAPKALADGHSSVTDMSHETSEDFPTYFGVPGISYEQTMKFSEVGVNLNVLTLNEHTGTHVDAPLHFSEDGQSVSEIPVSNLVVPLCVIDIAARAAEDADTSVTPDDIKAWTDAHGAIPEGACVAMHSGWGAHVASDKFRNVDGDGVMHFPGFHVEAAQALIDAGAGSMAVDTLSLDHGISTTFDTHYAWLPTNRFGIENLANLDKVPASGATLVIGAPKTRNGTGGPARIFAMI